MVQIGLKFPSDFIIALSQTYGVGYSKVELGLSSYLEAILFSDNLMESVDVWKNQGIFSVDVIYNYGPGITVSNKPMQLIGGSTVYFEEFLIREVLHKMQAQNGINFKFNANKGEIELIGKLQNLPRLTLKYQGYAFKLQLTSKILHYIPALQNTDRLTLVGYHAIKGYNNLAFLKNGEIEFKATGMIYELYLYLLYFVALFLFMSYYLRSNIFEASQFVKNIFKWLIFKDAHARVEVLKSELE
jgi:hypothetical protein